MNTASPTATPGPQLPWAADSREDRWFRWLLYAALLALLVVGTAVPLLPVSPLPQPVEQKEDATLARLLLEPQPLPEPQREEPGPDPEVEPPPEPPPETVAAETGPAPVPDARELARVAGVMALQDELMAMRDTVDVESLAGASLSRGQSAAATVERAVITAGQTAGSGGIESRSLSVNASGSALSAREATRVSSRIADDTAASSSRRSGGNRAGGAATGGRSDDSIRRVMDSNKGAIFAIYHRALRSDPALEGKLVFEMVIDPAGSVVSATLLSSELNDDALTRRILARIRMIRFGAEPVRQTRVNYSFDFLPYG